LTGLHSKRSITKSFTAFWLRLNWSESEKKNQRSRGGGALAPTSPGSSMFFFFLAPICAQPECGKALRKGTIAILARVRKLQKLVISTA